MYRHIEERDYKTLLAAAQAVCPTPKSVGEDILGQWYGRLPEFGFVFTNEKDQITGWFAVIPLSRFGWESLISGRLTERDMKGECIFNPEKDVEIGLHCFYIENVSEEVGFHEEALKALNAVLHAMPKMPHVLGFSAYAISVAGIDLFEKKLEMRARALPVEEYVVTKSGQTEVVQITGISDFNARLDDGYIFRNKCTMLVTTPADISPVWQFLHIENDILPR